MSRMTGPFAQVLEARREGFNARFALQKREMQGLDGAAVLAFLRDTMPAIAEPMLARSPEEGPAACERLFAVALPLIGRDLLGPRGRSPAVALAWGETLPRLAPQLLAEPERLSRAVTNALFALESQPGTQPEVWADELPKLAALAPTVSDLLEAGKVLGWRCGLAQYRRSALEVAGRLPPPLAAAALALRDPARLGAALERMRNDPWSDPETPATATAEIRSRSGGFRGLGGPFLAPPRVALADGGLVASDGHGTFTLHADRFGCAFLPSRGEFPVSADPGAGLWQRLSRALSKPAPGPGLAPDGTLTLNGVERRLPALSGASSWAFDGFTLAVTHPMSHLVTLVAPGSP